MYKANLKNVKMSILTRLYKKNKKFQSRYLAIIGTQVVTRT